MLPVHISALALLAATFIRMAVGMVWYSPVLFGPAWMRLTNRNPGQMKKEMGTAMPLDLLASFVMAFALVHVVRYASADNFPKGAIVGFVCWLGFIAASHLAGVLYEKRPLKLYVINMSGQLISLILMAGVLAVWQ
jgi:hypothetical protein